MPTLPLTGTGGARAAGAGTTSAKLYLLSDSGASAGGAGYTTLMPGEAGASAGGVGNLTWPHAIHPPGLEDRWFYGSVPTGRKQMSGSGAARAG